MSELVSTQGNTIIYPLNDVKYVFTPLIHNAYFAHERSSKGKEKNLEELKKIYTEAGGDLTQLHDKNGDVKGGVEFYKVRNGGNSGDLEFIAKNHMTGGDSAKEKNLKRLKESGYTNTLSKDQIVLFEMKEPEPLLNYEKITKASLCETVYLVVESKKDIGTKIKVEIVEDGTFINTAKDTPLDFQEITGTKDKPTKTEKKLFTVELTRAGEKGLNEGIIKLELAPKSEETLKTIQDKFAPDKLPELPTAEVFAANFTPITEAEKLTADQTSSKIFSIGAISGQGLSAISSKAGIIGGYKSLQQLNGMSTSTNVSATDVFYYREDSLTKTKEAFDKVEKAKIAKEKKAQEKKKAETKEKTTNLYIRGKDGESIVKSKCILDGKPIIAPWMKYAEQEYKLYKGINEDNSPLKERIEDHYHPSTTLGSKHHGTKTEWDREVPWCASFVNWCFNQTENYKNTNLSSVKNKSYNSQAFDWGEGNWENGEKCEAFYGAIIVLKYSHTAFIVGKNYEKNKYVYLGGNQGDQIKYGTITIGKEKSIMKPKNFEPSSSSNVLKNLTVNADGSFTESR